MSHDPDATGYVKTPLDFAPAPDRMAHRLFDSLAITTHLNPPAQRQQSDGGWPISWTPPSPAAVGEWRAYVTIKSLVVLASYGRLHTGPA